MTRNARILGGLAPLALLSFLLFASIPRPGIADCVIVDQPECACYVGVAPWPLIGPLGDLLATADLTLNTAESCTSEGGQPYWQIQRQGAIVESADFLAHTNPAIDDSGSGTERMAWCTETVAWWGLRSNVPYAAGYYTGWHPSSYLQYTREPREWYETEDSLRAEGALARGRWIDGTELDYADFQPGVNAPCPGAYSQQYTYEVADTDSDGTYWNGDISTHSQVVDSMFVYHLDFLGGPVQRVDTHFIEGNVSNRIVNSRMLADIYDFTVLGDSLFNGRKIRGWGINLESDGDTKCEEDRIIDLVTFSYPRAMNPPLGSENYDSDLVGDLVNFDQVTGGGQFIVTSNSPLVHTGGALPTPQNPWIIPPAPHPVDPVLIDIDLLQEHPIPLTGITLEWKESAPIHFLVMWADQNGIPNTKAVTLAAPPPPMPPGALINFPIPFSNTSSVIPYGVRYLRLVFPNSVLIRPFEIDRVHFNFYANEPEENEGGTDPPIASPCPPIADHDIGNVRFSVTDQGVTGLLDAGSAQGSGFVFPKNGGLNRLYLGSLWVGTDASYMLNRDFTTDKDWRREGCFVMEPGLAADQEGLGSYRDAGHPMPRGLHIAQESFAWASPPDDDYVMMSYAAINHGTSPITGLWMGKYMDWDLDGTNGYDQNRGGVDLGRSLIYMWREGGGDGTYVGIKSLSHNPVPQMSLIHNPTYIYPPGSISDADRFHFLSGDSPAYIVHSTPTPSDWSMVMGIGPINLAPGNVARVGFAILAGTSLADLQANADAAQAKWNSIWGGVTDTPLTTIDDLPQRCALLGDPNPFRGRTVLTFDIARRGPASVHVYDVTGRKVATVFEGILERGRYVRDWNAKDGFGRDVASGVYFARLESGGEALVKKLVLLK